LWHEANWAGNTGVTLTCVRVAGLVDACAAVAVLCNPLALSVVAHVVDGALVAIVARLTVLEHLSAFACSEVNIRSVV
jgi:hypothetical protein